MVFNKGGVKVMVFDKVGLQRVVLNKGGVQGMFFDKSGLQRVILTRVVCR